MTLSGTLLDCNSDVVDLPGLDEVLPDRAFR